MKVIEHLKKYVNYHENLLLPRLGKTEYNKIGRHGSQFFDFTIRSILKQKQHGTLKADGSATTDHSAFLLQRRITGTKRSQGLGGI